MIHRAQQHRSTLPGIEAVTLLSHHRFPRHSHDQFGIGVLDFGAQRSWRGIGSVEATAGDVIMVNPGEMHDSVPVDQNPRGWRMLYFHPALVARELKEETDGEIEIAHPVASDIRLAEQFNRLFACLTSADALAQEESLLSCLLYVLGTHCVKRTKPVFKTVCVQRAIQRLDADPTRPVTLAELAALSAVSRFQLLRGFSRQVGITPHAYLVQRRVSLAKQLLAQGHAPVEAALRAGFADQSHMSRVFVRQFGITPGRYAASVS